MPQTYFSGYQPGVAQPRGSAAWYAKARRTDTVLGTASTAGTALLWDGPYRKTAVASLAYVTGSHNFKTGVQWSYGIYGHSFDANADLIQIYLNRVPTFVDVSNTPTRSQTDLNAELGVYAQDSWRIKRVTLNAGVRYEKYDVGIPASSAPAGRFVPARRFPAFPCVPCWTDVVPRFAVAYDLFGNGKTAIKGGIAKFMSGQRISLTDKYNPLASAREAPASQLDRRDWRDLNGDDIAQDNEIGPSNNLNFAAGTRSSRLDPNLQRPDHWQYTVNMQHELLPGLMIGAEWLRADYRNLFTTTNQLVGLSDYTSFQTPNPLNNGEIITVYNLNRSKQGQIDLLDTTANPEKTRRNYQSFAVNFSGRFPGGGTAFGGVNWEQTVDLTCDTVDPNRLRFCDQSGKQFQELGKSVKAPYLLGMKLSGAQPLPWRFQVGAVFQSTQGLPISIP